MGMVFKGVEIKRDFRGKLTGNLHVEGEYGWSMLRVSEDLCAEIMSVCADSIVKAAEETASGFRQESMMIGGDTVDHD